MWDARCDILRIFAFTSGETSISSLRRSGGTGENMSLTPGEVHINARCMEKPIRHIYQSGVSQSEVGYHQWYSKDPWTLVAQQQDWLQWKTVRWSIVPKHLERVHCCLGTNVVSVTLSVLKRRATYTTHTLRSTMIQDIRPQELNLVHYALFLFGAIEAKPTRVAFVLIFTTVITIESFGDLLCALTHIN